MDHEVKRSLAERILIRAKANGIKIACAESCTGGLVGAALTDIPGSSEIFNGSAVTYSNEAKKNILGVRDETLRNFGAVSEQCAAEMAQGALKVFDADVAVSITGIAGPDGGSIEKPVGTVCFGLASADGVKTFREIFPGNRADIRESAVVFALEKFLNGGDL